MNKNQNRNLTIGVDLGGTKVEMALVDADGHIVNEYKYSTNAEIGFKRVISKLVENIAAHLVTDKYEPKALGIGIAAQVDLQGKICTAPNLGWQNIELQRIMEKRIELPTLVTNDVRAATYGEWMYGSGRGSNDIIVLFMGTGIGGGVISGGHILEGCTNTAGELGHITIVENGRKCHCPNRGCLEAYAGGWAIAERAREAVVSDPVAGQYLLSIAKTSENITAEAVGQAYHERDPLSQKLMEETINYLGAGITGIVNAFNPCLVVLGGGVIEGIPELIEPIKKIVCNRALLPAVKKLKFVKATLSGKAGVIGVATLARKLGDLKQK